MIHHPLRFAARVFLCSVLPVSFAACARPETPTLEAPQTLAALPGPFPVFEPPPTAHVAVTINSFGDTSAISGLTAVRFDLTQSTGYQLRYRIGFGDGRANMSTEPVSTHVYERGGYFRAQATVIDRWGRNDTTSIIYVSVVGLAAGGVFWPEILKYPVIRALDFDTQQGRQLQGRYYQWGEWAFDVHGSLSGERNLYLRVNDGREFSGEVIFNNQGRRLLLRQRGGSDDGKTKSFNFYSTY